MNYDSITTPMVFWDRAENKDYGRDVVLGASKVFHDLDKNKTQIINELNSRRGSTTSQAGNLTKF